MRMGLVLDDEDDVCGDLVGGLVALPLEGDLGACLPAGLDTDGQDLLLFAGGAVVGHHSPRDLHPLGHPPVDVLQGHQQVVLDRRVLLFSRVSFCAPCHKVELA